ncbi:MAG: thiamine phosphate synthase [Candidatus Omnitrophica bacterium]|nr:thiamine phosphate synthase [Candidatus Omnitrophota bacterium]
MDLQKIDFYFITDSNLTRRTVAEDVESALSAGVKIIQYREKNKSAREMVEEASLIKKMCNGKSIFLINDRVDIALAVGAGGVHLGQDDMPYHTARLLLGEDKIIGLTAHSAEEAVLAEKDGADYIGASPVFDTETKPDAGKGGGLELIRDIRKNVKIPVVAIGGINLNNVASVISAGADSAAAISAVVASDNVEEECRRFIKVIQSTQENCL